MSRLPIVQHEPIDDGTIVEDDIPTYCIRGQQSDSFCAIEEDRVRTLPMSISKSLRYTKQTDAHCRNMVEVVGTDIGFALDESEMIS